MASEDQIVKAKQYLDSSEIYEDMPNLNEFERKCLLELHLESMEMRHPMLSQSAQPRNGSLVNLAEILMDSTEPRNLESKRTYKRQRLINVILRIMYEFTTNQRPFTSLSLMNICVTLNDLDGYWDNILLNVRQQPLPMETLLYKNEVYRQTLSTRFFWSRIAQIHLHFSFILPYALYRLIARI